MSVVVTPPGPHFFTPGDEEVFGCIIYPHDEMNVQWLVDGVVRKDLVDAIEERLSPGVWALTFRLSSEFNMKRIGCRAIYTDGSVKDSSDSTLLLLQG